MFVQPAFNNSVQLGFAPSQYSPGGQYNMAPSQTYINPYYNQAQQGAAQQQASGPNLLDAASNVKSIISPNSSGGGSGIFGNVNSAVNNFGQTLGFASGNVMYPASAGFIGPSLPGASAGFIGPSLPSAGAAVPGSGLLGSGGATLGGTLGAAGIGAFAGSFLGKIGGNSTGGSIGGALGAAVGNMILPGVGGIIGGALGGIGGGFFGGNKPATQSTTWMAADFTPEGTFHSSYGSKNAGNMSGYEKTIEGNVSSILQDAHKELGINYNPKLSLLGGYNSLNSGDKNKPGFLDTLIRHGENQEEGRVRINFDPNKPEEVNQAYLTTLKNAAAISGYTDTAKLEEWFKQKTGATNGNSSYIVPIKDKTRFDDFMAKFQSQGTVNGTNATPTTPTT